MRVRGQRTRLGRRAAPLARRAHRSPGAEGGRHLGSADAAALADGLATALFFTEAHRLAQTFEFAYVRMYASGHAEISRNFDGELFA